MKLRKKIIEFICEIVSDPEGFAFVLLGSTIAIAFFIHWIIGLF